MSDWFKFKNDGLDSKGMQFAMGEQPLVTSVWLVILSEASKNRSCRIAWRDEDFELIGYARKINVSVPVFNQCIGLLKRIGYIIAGDGCLDVPGWDDFQSDYAKGLQKGYYKKTSKKLASNSLDTSVRGEERRGEYITHTRAAEAAVLDFPEANIPTLKEVLAEADMRGASTESATSFFNHHQDNTLWVNQYGRLIDWKSKLINWSARDKAMPSKPASASQQPLTVYGLKTIIEAKRGQADALKAKSAIETGLDTTWSDPRAREEHQKLRREIKELNGKLARMA